jgi:predicted MFS family arabinose efflux permease
MNGNTDQNQRLTANAMRWFFFFTGVGICVWAIIVPYTKIRFHLDDGTLGLMLLAGGTGGVVCMPFGGLAVGRWGSRDTLLVAISIVAVLMPVLVMVPSPAVFVAVLFIYGFTFGVLDVALNAQAAVIEARSGRLLMSGFHACYSIGSLSIAVVTALLLKIGLSNAECAGLATALGAVILFQARYLLPKSADQPPARRHFAVPNRAAVVLGLCCFVCFFTEGAATDWSTIFMRFSRGMALSSAAFGYAAFAVTMAATRLAGDRVAMRLGQTRVMQLSCVLAALGFALAIFVPYPWAGIIGFGLVGLGTGNIAPLVLSAAARVPGMAANHSVPAVMALGYAGFLAGPPLIGIIASHFTLSTSFGIDALFLVAIFFAARAVRA